MGEALFDIVLAELRKSGIPKGPLVGSLIFLFLAVGPCEAHRASFSANESRQGKNTERSRCGI
jgi:hypothetical protein